MEASGRRRCTGSDEWNPVLGGGQVFSEQLLGSHTGIPLPGHSEED